jgi:hypothetical protein
MAMSASILPGTQIKEGGFIVLRSLTQEPSFLRKPVRLTPETGPVAKVEKEI